MLSIFFKSQNLRITFFFAKRTTNKEHLTIVLILGPFIKKFTIVTEIFMNENFCYPNFRKNL